MKSSLTNLFRELTYKEKHHTRVLDFRNIINPKKKPNNSLIITCEHATNNLHQYKNLASSSDLTYINTHWGYDIGALDIASKLAEDSESLLIYPNFSRLILDPNRSLISTTLIRKNVEVNVEIDMNKEEIQFRNDRLRLFYYPYYSILNEVMSFIRPSFFISVHTFTSTNEDGPVRDYSVGLLYSNKERPNLLVKTIEKKLIERKVSFRHNEPYTSEVLNAYNMMETYDYPTLITGLCIEIRNDLAVDFDFSHMICGIMKEVVVEVEEMSK